LIFAAGGSLLSNAQDANAYLSAAWSEKAVILASCVHLLDEAFFNLRTGVAGEIIQGDARQGWGRRAVPPKPPVVTLDKMPAVRSCKVTGGLGGMAHPTQFLAHPLCLQ
jgi:hypothetical protein